MDESDGMLITTLRQFINIQSKISTLHDIKAQQIFTISLQVLQFLKIDINQIKSLSGKAQRFRSMAKLNQNLYNELQTVFQLNQLMNPSIPFLRKFLLLIINKLGSLDNNQKKKTNRNENKSIKRQEKIELKTWLNQQWIHPSLVNKRPKYRGFILPLTITKNLLKNNLNITSELNNPLLENNIQSIISGSIAKHNQRVKEFQANQGISRKQMQEAQVKFQNIVKSNKDDWNISQNKLQKIKKKAVEQNIQSTIQIPQAPSVFKQQLQEAQIQAQKKKMISQSTPIQQSKHLSPEELTSLNPMQLLKKQAQRKRQQYENQIKNILNQLKERKQKIENWQKQKQSIENKIITDQQKIAKIKQQTAQLKKHVQKRQTILSTLEGEKDIQEQVKKLQRQINDIEQQVKQQTEKIKTQTKQLQTQSQQKMEALTDLKLKLNKIQNDYQNICQEIVEKQELKGGVKIMKSGISRLYYHKKISQIQHRWKQTERQTKKIRDNLVELREKTRISGTLNLRMEIQIDNFLNIQKTRNEPQTKVLKELLTKCKQSFQKTYSILQQVNNVKMQTQQYQMKVHSLSGKNYKQNIDKIAMAMQQLKKQIYGSKSKVK